jgi:hypothetical protein
MNPIETVATDTRALVASVLLAACDEEIGIARRIGTETARQHDGDRRTGGLDSAYSRAGFACGGREALEVIVGDGVHAPRASTEVRLRYDGWATIAEQQGCPELAADLRAYVREHRGGGGILVEDAIAYLDGARRVISAA